MNVFNCVSGAECPVRWGDLQVHGMKALKVNVLNDVIWYPALTFTKHKTVNTISAIFKHWVPAYMMDFLAKLSGKKPM